jgi:hypothetical protein
MSDTSGPGQPEERKNLHDGSDLCFEQKQRAKQVEHELHKLANRLERDKVANIFHLQVFAFNCDDKKHDKPHTLHFDYVAGGGRLDVPNSLQTTIKALEHALAQLKKQVQ